MRVLLAIWTNPAWHSTVVFTAQLFAEHGCAVEIISKKMPPDVDFIGTVDFGKGTRVRSVGHGSTGWQNRLDYLSFIRAVRRRVQKLQPDIVIGYDLHGFVAATLACAGRSGIQSIYHNFDLVPRTGMGAFVRLLTWIEVLGARHANYVLFSSPGRASMFQEYARLRRDPIVVMNCQRLATARQRTGELDRLLAQQNLQFERLVIRLGSLGPEHGIEATIRSIVEWQGNWGLLLVGYSPPAYLRELQALVASLNLEGRVVCLPDVSQSLWYDCLYAGHLGIALYEAGNINHATMAGAGNKLNLYLKAGIPSIVPSLSDFESLADRTGAAEVVDPTDPHSIANAINLMLSDPLLYALRARNAQEAFRTEFNFEHQFAPILCGLLPHTDTGCARLHLEDSSRESRS